MVKLGEILTPETTTEKFNHPENETFMTVKLHGRGAVERIIGIGKTPKPFTGFRVKSGQFIYSRIDARNGAFAIIPPELDGAVVSKDFPVFSIDPTVDPGFLNFLCTTPVFEKTIQAKSNGATNRQRIKEDVFLSLKVPLPPLEEQKRIARILEMADNCRVLSAKGENEYLAVDKAILRQFHQSLSSELSRFKLGDLLLSIESGKSPSCSSGPATESHQVGVLKLSAVTSGRFIEAQNKEFLGEPGFMESKVVHKGDVLMTRKNTPELVGATAIVDTEPVPTLYFPDLVFRLKADNNLVKDDYLALLLMTEPVRTRVRSLAGGSAKSMSNISQAKLKDMPIDILPLEEQSRLMRSIEAMSKLERMQTRRTKAITELQESLSVRAFNGSL